MELKVVFRNARQEKLIGILSAPQSGIPDPCVILVHGFASSKDALFFPDLAGRLAAAGIASLRFDAHACGESEGHYHPTYATLVDDVLAAVAYLKKAHSVTRIGLVGHSMGGTAVLFAALNEPAVCAVVTFGAVAHPGNSARTKQSSFTQLPSGEYVLPRRNGSVYHFSASFFTDAAASRPLDEISSLDVPALFIHGSEDDRIDVHESEELLAACGSSEKRLLIVQGADHLFAGAEGPLRDAVAFFVAHLL